SKTSPNRLSCRYVSAAAACARAPTRTRRGWVASSVIAAPAATPRRTREILRFIIREPFRLRQPPTMGLDRRGYRPYETRRRARVGWSLSPGLPQYGSHLP